MLNKRILTAILTILSFSAIALADAAPEPGYTRIGKPLIIQPQDDFTGYRFFLDSPGGIEEITLTKGKDHYNIYRWSGRLDEIYRADRYTGGESRGV